MKRITMSLPIAGALLIFLALPGVSEQTAAPSSSDLTITTSELTPIVGVETARPHLTLFGHLGAWGLGAPRHVACVERGRIVVRSAPGADSAGSLCIDGKRLSEPWLLVWFGGGAGWSRWDAPWLVVWQLRPESIRLDSEGLSARAEAGFGHVALMPLFGLGKPDTSRWSALPADVVHRCRFWARAARAVPFACDESFRLEPRSESVDVRSAFRWLATQDDWKTPPLKLAPLSPTLALAYQSRRLPMTLSGTVYDPGVVTPYGPYLGIRSADSYEARFRVLSYVTQAEQEPKPDTSSPVIESALRRLRSAMSDTFSNPDGLFHQDFGDPPDFASPPPQVSNGGNTCWALMSTQYYCRALPYLPSDVVARARIRLHRYFADWVLQPNRFKAFRGKMLLVGPGIGTWGGYDDAGKFSSNTLITLYTYGRYTGDWDLLKERWPLIKQLFVTPRECTWRGWGRGEIAEMGDEAAPALAMARIAYHVGDRDAFGYATYIFARELAHHIVKHTGAAYFVKHQPISTDEWMPPNVYLTNIWGDTAGWQIDGPTWPKKTGERQYTNRWVRYGDPDVARFHRDHLEDLDRAELDGLLASGRLTTLRKNTLDDPHILPSMVRLRSLLLNESPEQLARISPVGANVHSNSGIAAYCMAFLRTSSPPILAAEVPTDKAGTEWAQGISREVMDEPVLTAAAAWTIGKSQQPGPPALTWFGWKPPHGDAQAPGGDRWSFGQILTDRPIMTATATRPSWNTQTVSFR